eukprot:1956817-Alexandrium_andersonii.AAC.1
MSASLVGSEMCIRDSPLAERLLKGREVASRVVPPDGVVILDDAEDHLAQGVLGPHALQRLPEELRHLLRR